MSADRLIEDEQRLLLDVAEQSVACGLEFGRAVDVDVSQCPAAVARERASFVTLRVGVALRGCIGSLRAQWALVEDVAKNAFAAGFRDPRFPPLSAGELKSLSMSISVLGEPETVPVASERELLERMQADEAGWILQHGQQRGLLLPAVWETVADPREFLEHLKCKARLAADFWSADVVVQRFTAHSFGRVAQR
ncbi:MAG: AmmeMemoRadiSam system protein A [Planctomycetaceae bacterium]